ARIARALLRHPEWLILDEPFLGLDSAGRTDVASLLEHLIEQGNRVLLITRPTTIPTWVTHILEMDCLVARWQGSRSDFLKRLGGKRWFEPVPPNTSPPRSTQSEPIVELRNVHVAYGGRSVLQGVNWNVRAGERWAVLGPNGSGKST